MKWYELYTHLVFQLPNGVTQGLDDIFDLIRDGDSFSAHLTKERSTSSKKWVIEDALEVRLIILSMQATPQGDLIMTVQTESGHLPAGMKHGTYVIQRDPYEKTTFPPEMFEDGDVPDDLIPTSRLRKS